MIGNFEIKGVEMINVATRFVCIPGVNPVKIPKIIPVKNEIINPNIS